MFMISDSVTQSHCSFTNLTFKASLVDGTANFVHFRISGTFEFILSDLSTYSDLGHRVILI